MKDYGRVRSPREPAPVEITPYDVFVCTNIEPYTEVVDDKEITGYEYNLIDYQLYEYLQIYTDQSTRTINDLEDQLHAAKILLGVE